MRGRLCALLAGLLLWVPAMAAHAAAHAAAPAANLPAPNAKAGRAAARARAKTTAHAGGTRNIPRAFPIQRAAPGGRRPMPITRKQSAPQLASPPPHAAVGRHKAGVIGGPAAYDARKGGILQGTGITTPRH